MAEKPKPKAEEEEDDDQFTCAKCGTVYADTAEIRRIVNRLAKGRKKFKCPDCLAEEEAEREDAEAEEDEEATEDEKEEAEEPEAPAAPPAKKRK